MRDFTIGVVGNPNCGKTTLFNALTGARQRVGNWPGVTVDRKTGEYTHGQNRIFLVDLPGIYSLSATSLDEAVARDYILSGEADLIVNILDASNLERNLYLTIQLLEMKVPLLVVLNMMDVARDRQIKIDIHQLSQQLGCPVVPMVAARGDGVDILRGQTNTLIQSGLRPTFAMEYPPAIASALDTLAPSVRTMIRSDTIDPGYAALKLLEGDAGFADMADREILAIRDEQIRRIEAKEAEEVDILVADCRYGLIGRIVRQTVRKSDRLSRTVSDRIDRVVLNRILGLPIFLLAMYLTFMVTINIGGVFIDFFDIFFGTIVVDGFAHLLAAIQVPEWGQAILAGGIGGAVQTIATFIPPIAFMFLCLCFLEDSGYMARAAFVMDRCMRVIGLPGKAFIPMLVGFGCNVPAIMATRTLENQRDRTLTVLMNPFMSCGARLPVYALFAAAFFPVGGQNLVFALYLIGIAFALLTGLILKNTLLRGEMTPFVMELPPYHRPTLKGVVFRTWDRLQTFIFRAGKVILPVVVVLSFLNTLGTDGSIGNEDTDKSVLSAIGQSITPVFAPLGVSQENWPAAVGIFTGIFAKEAVVGTLDALYSHMDAGNEADAAEAGGFDLMGGITEALASVPANLAGLADMLLDPLGLSIGDVSSIDSAAEAQAVNPTTFGSMIRLFDGRSGAFAYLLMVLLYVPCVAAIAAIYRETNLNWTLFACCWNAGLAYVAAVLFYQTATILRHPGSSLFWITGMLLLVFLVWQVLSYLGRQQLRPRVMTGRAPAPMQPNTAR